MKNKTFTNLVPLLGLIGLGLAVLLSACGDTAPGITPPDKPCIIVESNPGGVNGLGKPNPITISLDKNSPEYCQHVKDDFKAAMAWYRDSLANDTYGPNMDKEFANYYAPPLLGQARASLFYNKQANRVLAGQFTATSLTISDQTWTKDGTKSILTVSPGTYTYASFPAGQPKQGEVYESSRFESWQMTMIYDAKAGHWKISQAETVFSAVGG